MVGSSNSCRWVELLNGSVTWSRKYGAAVFYLDVFLCAFLFRNTALELFGVVESMQPALEWISTEFALIYVLNLTGGSHPQDVKQLNDAESL